MYKGSWKKKTIFHDIWIQSYIGLTAHFITDNWKLHSCVQQTLYFPESYAGELISDKLKEIYIHFSLPLGAAVHDVGSKMRASLRVLHGTSDWGTCRMSRKGMA